MYVKLIMRRGEDVFRPVQPEWKVRVYLDVFDRQGRLRDQLWGIGVGETGYLRLEPDNMWNIEDNTGWQACFCRAVKTCTIIHIGWVTLDRPY